ncbi:MAG TPA: lysophospholipid acyltransferase family protein [Polyangia bacterium]
MSVRTLPRTVFQGLFLLGWSAGWISLALLVAAVTWSRELPLAMARKIWAPPLIRLTGARYQVDPLPALDFSRPHIFVMNHQSMLDIACAFAALPVNLRFVAKNVLKFVPFLGWYMWATGMIFVDRTKGVRALRSLAQAAARVRDGASILAFPEGTRSKTGEVLPFKRGLFALAMEAGVPIVPVAIEGSGKVLSSGRFHCVPGDVRLRVGAPIATAGRPRNGRDALMNEVRDALLELHRQIGGGGGQTLVSAATGTD